MKKQQTTKKEGKNSEDSTNKVIAKQGKLTSPKEKYKHKNHWLEEEDDEFVPPLRKKKKKK